MSLKVKVELDSIEKILKKRGLEERGKVQKYIDSEAIRLMSPYTPFAKVQGGTLIDSATKLTDIGSGRVEQGGKLAPYGRKWYYTKAHFNEAPRRGTYWFRRAMDKGGRDSIFKGIKRMVGL